MLLCWYFKMGGGISHFDAKVLDIQIDVNNVKISLFTHLHYSYYYYLHMNNGNFKQLYDMLKINKVYRFTICDTEITNIEEPTIRHGAIFVEKYYELSFNDGNKMYKIISENCDFYVDSIDGIENDKQYAITYSLDGYCNGYKIKTIEEVK